MLRVCKIHNYAEKEGGTGTNMRGVGAGVPPHLPKQVFFDGWSYDACYDASWSITGIAVRRFLAQA